MINQMLDAQGRTEAEYIEEFRKKNYPKPSLTADIVVLGHEELVGDHGANGEIYGATGGTEGNCYVLLIKRKGHPFIGCWALPGGFADQGECIEETAARELLEETGVGGLELKPVGLFSRPGRDPRGWTVSQAYRADVNLADCKPIAGDDAATTKWCRIAGGLAVDEEGQKLKLAFDHEEILAKAMKL